MFKKIRASEKISTDAGYTTNGKWMFKNSWILATARRENRQLRNRVAKAQLENVTAKIQGAPRRDPRIQEFLNVVDLSDFRPVSPEQARPVEGFIRGDSGNYGTVAFQLGGCNGPGIDVEFYPALQWDKEATILVRGKLDPIFLAKAGEIVAAIAAVRLDK